MVLSGLTVGAAVTPTVIETLFSHYIHRKPLHEKPTAHISYHVGLQLVRKFIIFSSHHTVEELQSFTSQWVPNPHWIRTEDVVIPQPSISSAAKAIQAQLGPNDIGAVGGSHWWQWRQDGNPLEAEWIEMRKHFNTRKQTGEKCSRCMLYVHGGAYYFGSVDEHRYQMQRHARKLQARILAPRYRLAPQFPFPCGLLDCLATYMFLLTVQPPETIVLAGDSAGAGMIVSMLVILRDQDIPLPAGAILLSPWVDLTHSFPSVAGWNELDYVPPHGFQHKPSNAWPPPNSDDLKVLEQLGEKGADLMKMKTKDIGKELAKEAGKSTTEQHKEASQGFTIHTPNANNSITTFLTSLTARYADHARNLTLTIDEKTIEIKDQVQIYTTNLLLSHPLVSPILQPSLGGLPPLLVLVGGGEMLRDEQIYLAHKAANPTAYPPSNAHLTEQGGAQATEQVSRWPPTNVQLQVWEDLCHVAPTLSFTRPAKYMYRSVAQFGAWVLARAQRREIEILDDDDISVISSRSSTSTSSRSSSPSSRSRPPVRKHEQQNQQQIPNHTTSFPPPNHHTNPYSLTSPSTNPSLAPTSLGKAGAPLTPFINHMIRQQVDRHGNIYPLPPANTLPACTMPRDEIGFIKPGPVRKWLEAQTQWGKRYAKEKRSLQSRRMREMQKGSADARRDGSMWFGPGGKLEGEKPPPTAMVGRVARGGPIGKGEGLRGKKRVLGGRALRVWSGWGSRHDEVAVEKEEEKERLEDESEDVGGGGGRGSVVRKASVAPGTVSEMTQVNGNGDVAVEDGGLLAVPPVENAETKRRSSRSRKKSVIDEGQIPHHNTSVDVTTVHHDTHLRTTNT